MNNISNKINYFYVALILFIIIFVIHIDIVFAPLGYYFSNFDLKDLNYYINIRKYSFDKLLSGIFPLWTTKLFCGIPFFANSETAIFYLPNIIFYFLPISKAFNLSFLLHFFIFSFGVFLWVNNKIKDIFVSLTVAIISVFMSSFYLHACAGHLSNIITIVWFPYLLYFYDKIFEKKNYFYIFIISFILSLQIFAGHYQYIYYSALVSLAYILLFCKNKHVFYTLILSYFISLCLVAIQFLPSLDFYFEGARKFGILRHFSLYSNIIYLLTVLFPITIFKMSTSFWETSNYIGIINFFIIIVALFFSRNKYIYKYLILSLLIYLFSFKFFSNLANYYIPFFSYFRSPIKLNFFLTVFLLPILAYGLKYIFSKETEINKYFILISMLFALILIMFKNNIVTFLVNILNKTNGFSILCCNLSIMSLVFLVLLFACLIYFKKYSVSKIIIVLLLIIEPSLLMRFCSRPFLFNNDYKYEYTLKDNFNQQERYLSNNYYSLSYNTENMSGSVPDLLYNYFRFTKYLEKSFNEENILGLLRCKYIVDDETKSVSKIDIKTLNRLNIFYNYKIEINKEKIFELLSRKDFNIFNTVVLEKQPQYEVKDKGEYELNILYFDENSIEFECKTNKPAIILYTDNYSRGWRAYNLDNSKEKYEIICADYIYKAISINEGTHKIRIEYKPLSFIIGMWISIVSWIIFISFFIFFYIKNFYKNKIKFYIILTLVV